MSIMSSGYPFSIRSKGQRVMLVTGHKMQKQISVEGDRVAGVILHSIDWPVYSYYAPPP